MILYELLIKPYKTTKDYRIYDGGINKLITFISKGKYALKALQ